jgi:hypothetical protein
MRPRRASSSNSSVGEMKSAKEVRMAVLLEWELMP